MEVIGSLLMLVLFLAVPAGLGWLAGRWGPHDFSAAFVGLVTVLGMATVVECRGPMDFVVLLFLTTAIVFCLASLHRRGLPLPWRVVAGVCGGALLGWPLSQARALGLAGGLLGYYRSLHARLPLWVVLGLSGVAVACADGASPPCRLLLVPALTVGLALGLSLSPGRRSGSPASRCSSSPG